MTDSLLARIFLVSRALARSIVAITRAVKPEPADDTILLSFKSTSTVCAPAEPSATVLVPFAPAPYSRIGKPAGNTFEYVFEEYDVVKLDETSMYVAFTMLEITRSCEPTRITSPTSHCVLNDVPVPTTNALPDVVFAVPEYAPVFAVIVGTAR